jgi:hypothetical protein
MRFDKKPNHSGDLTEPVAAPVTNPFASPKWNDPMPIEYTGGPSQDAIDVMAAWGTEMDAMYERAGGILLVKSKT